MADEQNQVVTEAESPDECEAPTLTPQDLAAVNAGYWAWLNSIQLQAGPFTFSGHEYQRDLFSCESRKQVVRKGTQAGVTEVCVIRCLHDMIFGVLRQGTLFLFPTSDSVTEFSKSRFKPLIEANRKTIGRYVHDTDSSNLKRIGNAFLYLRGARLSQKIEGDTDESSQLRSVPVDAVYFDECDLMEEEVMGKARGRLGHSTVKREVYVSNPVLPDTGVDKLFKQTDQRYWHRHCECGAWTCAELSFPECVKAHPDGKGYIACSKCGKPVGISPGEWIAQVPSNSDWGAGFHWSQLSSAFNDPMDIVRDMENPPEGNLADVYRLRLGLPYVAAEDKLQESQVLALCSNDYGPTGHPGPSAMGCDIGKTCHIIIGIRIGNDQYEILRATAVSGWSDIHDLAKRYGVRSAVIDIRPYEDSARQFQKTEPYIIHLCEYAESMPSGPQFNANTGIVKVNRTEAFDASHRLITTPGMLRLPRLGPEMKEFAKQVCGCAKVQEKNKKTGLIVYRYRTVGTAGDHFRNALNYFMLAASGGKVARVDAAAQNRPTRAINNFRVGVRR